jgi:hypothetical protein
VRGFWRNNVRGKVIICGLAAILLGCVLIFSLYSLSNVRDYYVAVNEVFGLPQGVGEKLSESDRNGLAEYWEISENILNNSYTLSFITKSGTVELLNANSTLYAMDYFQKPAKVVYNYIKGKNAHKTVTTVKYQTTGGLTLIELDYTDAENASIRTFEGSENTKLLNTRLYMVVNSDYRALAPISKMHVTYDSDELHPTFGLPKTRTIDGSSEEYAYNADKLVGFIYSLDDNGNVAPDNTGVAVVKLTYNPFGKVKEIMYYSDKNEGNATRGINSTTAEFYEYDRKSQALLSRSFLSESDSLGVSRYQYAYLSDTTIQSEKYYSEDNNNIYVGAFRGAYREYSWDKQKRSFSVTAGAENELSDSVWGLSPDEIYAFAGLSSNVQDVIPVHPDDGYSSSMDDKSMSDVSVTGIKAVITNYQLDTFYRITKESYSSADGAPIADSNGIGGVLYSYDKASGCIASETNITPIGGVLTTTNGYSTIKYEYSPTGELSSVSYWLSENTPAIRFDLGYHKRVLSYDIQKKYITENYSGIDGISMLCKNGYAEKLIIYDSNGHKSSEGYYDQHSKPTLNIYGIATIKYKYDVESGLLSERRYVDIKGNLAINLDPSVGYAMWKGYYYDSGLYRRIERYGTDEKLTTDNPYGTAGREFKYDQYGNSTEERNFGADGISLAFIKGEGYSIIRSTYGDKNRLREVSYWADANTRTINLSYCYSKKTIEYDLSGRLSDEMYFDIDGKTPLLERTHGAAHIHYDYDSYGNCEKTSYYGLDGKLTLVKNDGYASIERDYGEYGRVISIEYKDVDDNLIINRNSGYAKVVYFYNERGSVKEEWYYGITNDPILCKDGNYALKVNDYNSFGLTSRQSFFGIGGKTDSVLNSNSWAHSIIWEYDEYGRDKCGYWLGFNDEKITSASGNAGWLYEYNSSGNRIITTYLDTIGSPTAIKNGGYSRIKTDYNEKGKEELTTYWNVAANGIEIEAINTSTWCHSMRFEYDDHGRQINVVYNGLNGTSVLHKEWGLASYTNLYDEFGNHTGQRYYGINGEPVPLKSNGGGYSAYITKYSSLNQKSFTEFYNENSRGELEGCTDKFWVHKYEYTYDEYGNLKDIRYLDNLEALTNEKDYGFAHAMYTYNEWGIMSSAEYYDEFDAPVISRYYGFSVLQVNFDKYGRKKGENYFDADGSTPILDKSRGAASWTRDYDEAGNIRIVSYFDINDEEVIKKNGIIP